MSLKRELGKTSFYPKQCNFTADIKSKKSIVFSPPCTCFSFSFLYENLLTIIFSKWLSIFSTVCPLKIVINFIFRYWSTLMFDSSEIFTAFWRSLGSDCFEEQCSCYRHRRKWNDSENWWHVAIWCYGGRTSFNLYE